MGPKLGAALIAVVAVLGGVLPGPATAAEPPVHAVEAFDDTFTITGACDFPIEAHSTGTLHFIVFFREDGTLWKIITTLSHLDAFTLTANNSTVDAIGAGPSIATFDEWGQFQEGISLGVTVNVTVPGSGAVTLDAGRLVVTRGGVVSFEAGPHDFLEGDVAGLCEALG